MSLSLPEIGCESGGEEMACEGEEREEEEEPHVSTPGICAEFI